MCLYLGKKNKYKREYLFINIKSKVKMIGRVDLS